MFSGTLNSLKSELLGKKVISGRGLSKGDILDEEFLSNLAPSEWFKLRMKDEPLNDSIKEAKDKLKAYDICKGNFNLKTITKHTSIKDIFYDGSKIIKLKDKSDKSDLTMLHSNNNKKMSKMLYFII